MLYDFMTSLHEVLTSDIRPNQGPTLVPKVNPRDSDELPDSS